MRTPPAAGALTVGKEYVAAARAEQRDAGRLRQALRQRRHVGGEGVHLRAHQLVVADQLLEAAAREGGRGAEARRGQVR